MTSESSNHSAAAAVAAAASDLEEQQHQHVNSEMITSATTTAPRIRRANRQDMNERSFNTSYSSDDLDREDDDEDMFEEQLSGLKSSFLQDFSMLRSELSERFNTSYTSSFDGQIQDILSSSFHLQNTNNNGSSHHKRTKSSQSVEDQITELKSSFQEEISNLRAELGHLRSALRTSATKGPATDRDEESQPFLEANNSVENFRESMEGELNELRSQVSSLQNPQVKMGALQEGETEDDDSTYDDDDDDDDDPEDVVKPDSAATQKLPKPRRSKRTAATILKGKNRPTLQRKPPKRINSSEPLLPLPTGPDDRPLMVRSGDEVAVSCASTADEAKFVSQTSMRNLFWKQDEEHIPEALPEDSFSFLVVGRMWSHPFITSMAIFIIQMATYCLLLANTIRWGTKNPLSIPVNVYSTVRFTQLIAITITVLTQDDIRTGLSQINRGYDPKVIQEQYPYASWSKWVMCVVMRCIEGGVGIIVTFVLIVTAGTVLDLLLNFTAMEFVSQLDEIAFGLAKQGFLGKANMELSDQVTETELKMDRRGFKLPPIVLLIITMIGMLAGWGVVATKQSNGHFLCNTLYIQMGDDFDPNFGAFSGLYERQRDRTGFFSEERVVYVDRRSQRAMFGYCPDLKYWTFTYNFQAENLDPCKWKARSSLTLSYDLQSTSDWFIKDEDGKLAMLDPFFMQCYDCPEEEDKNKATCENRGICSDAICTCDNDWFGPRCEFPAPCQNAEMDSRSLGFLGERDWSTSYAMMKHENNSMVTSYDRPIFYNETQPGRFDLILFTGRRWIATHTDLLHDFLQYNANSMGELIEYFVDDFHAYWSIYGQAFVSEPVDVFTPSNLPTPVGLRWFNAIPSATITNGLQRPDGVTGTVDASLICSLCNNETNLCMHEGFCSSSGVCECAHETTGTLCQITPNGNGKCDYYYFNTPEFGYDGGDCCESTCVSTEEHSCGKDETGYVDVGYPHCHIMTDRWRLKGFAFRNTVFGEPPYSVSLSPNGQVLAVGEANLDRVHLFDKDGSEWVPRGPFVEGPPGTGFGAGVQLALRHSDATQVNNPLIKAEYRLLIRATVRLASDAGQTAIENYHRSFLYDCTFARCLEAEMSAVTSLSLSHLATISENGDTIATALFNNDLVHPPVEKTITVHEIDIPGINFSPPQSYFSQNYAIAISGSGTILAVGIAQIYRDPPGLSVTNIIRVYKLDSWQGGYFLNAKYLEENWSLLYDWTQSGDDIVDDCNGLFVMGDLMREGEPIALSFDGTVMAVGMPHRKINPGVDVFELKTTGGWEKLGATIVPDDKGFEKDLFGYNLDLSADGNILMVGCGPSQSKIYMYEWDGASWILSEQSFEGNIFDLSSDGSTIVIAGSQTPIVFQGPQVCQDGYSFFKFSLVLPSDIHEKVRGSTDWDDYQMYALRNNDDGHVTVDSVFEHFHSGPLSTLANEECMPSTECRLFYFTQKTANPNRAVEAGNYTIFEDGKEILKLSPGSDRDFKFHGSCSLNCPHDKQEVRLFIENGGPMDWYIKDETSFISGSTVIKSIGPTARSSYDWFVTWKDACLSKTGCIEVAVRRLFYDASFWNTVDYYPPILLIGEDRIELELITNMTEYNETYQVYVHKSCVDSSDFAIDETHLEAFLDKTDILLPPNQETYIPDDDSSTIPLTEPTTMNNPCLETASTVFVESPDDICGVELNTNTAYVLTNDMVCADSNGATMSSGTCLDCQGYVLSSNRNESLAGEWKTNPFIGIQIPVNTTGSTVYNCGIHSFEIGIKIAGTNNQVVHTDIYKSKMDGVRLNSTNNKFECSIISENKVRGISVTDDYQLTETSLYISNSVIEKNLQAIYWMIEDHWEDIDYQCHNRSQAREINVDCSVIRNNFDFGINTVADLQMTDVTASNNGIFNIGDKVTSISMDRVTSCGGAENDISLFDSVKHLHWSSVTCDNIIGSNTWCEGADSSLIDNLMCDSPCTGSCEESATCPDAHSVLPISCGALCSHPGRFKPSLIRIKPDEPSLVSTDAPKTDEPILVITDAPTMLQSDELIKLESDMSQVDPDKLTLVPT